MAGKMGCATRGGGKAYSNGGSTESPMHYRSGGMVKNPVRQPKAAPAPMPMSDMPMMQPKMPGKMPRGMK